MRRGAGVNEPKRKKRFDSRVMYRFIDAWGAEHGHPGYALCEVLEHQDGRTTVFRGKPVYVRRQKTDEAQTLLNIWEEADSGLKAIAMTVKIRAGESCHD